MALTCDEITALTATEQGDQYLRRQLSQAKNAMGKLGDRVEKAERAVRDITKDRDHWRAAAERLEAIIRSHGIDLQWRQGDRG